MPSEPSVIFQSAKLGDLPYIIKEFDRAEALFKEGRPIGRIYGVSGGALVALAFALALAAKKDPQQWGKAATAVADFRRFFSRARGWQIRTFNLNIWYGRSNLNPLRRWLEKQLKVYAGAAEAAPLQATPLPTQSLPFWSRSAPLHDPKEIQVSDLGIPLYICTIDRDAIFTMFGPPDDSLQCKYQFQHVGPPRDAPLVDAVIAAVSTLLSTSPSTVNGQYVYDCRPAIVDTGAMVADLEASDPRPILRTHPHAPIRNWQLNFITSSFIMHSQHERNQTLLADHYLDLLRRHRKLIADIKAKLPAFNTTEYKTREPAPTLGLVDLPYVGSTEAATNLRESAANRVQIMERFTKILDGQLDSFPFDRPANIIYGAGGCSGILGGLITSRGVNAGFQKGGGEVRQIYGVSAGVLNGFFHAIQVAAARCPDMYKPAARNALQDLEDLIARLTPETLIQFNRNPFRFWHGWANLSPLEAFLKERLSAYTGSEHPEELTFDDISLPMTVTAARSDGFTDFLGMTGPDRHFEFGGYTWKVLSAPVIKAVIAGWTMNTYIEPAELNGQVYRDGGGTFYDPSLLVACLDADLTNLIPIHLNHPEKGTFDFPHRPDIVRVILDTHNYTFPEEHRRMRVLATLLYDHFRLRRFAQENGIPVEPDFRREWKLGDTGYM
jgi:predicted acylesterase/phospholipase RssA